MNPGDTAWILMATAMVMLMTPAGLALFYGGLSNKKNVINTVGMSYVAFCVAFIVWILGGYCIGFSNADSILPCLSNMFLQGIPIDSVVGTIPELLFVAFQGVFAAIAVAIISGSVIERIKFSTWMIFSALWVLCVYAPIVRMIWGEGVFGGLGELDFAGGTVIHVNAGVAGLVLALLLGKRKKQTETTPSSIKLTILGSALLWFGWFGFNAGSQLAADFVAANAFLVTNVAACIGGISWLLLEWGVKEKPSILGLASGAISGLVGITPAAGYVDVSGALVIGLVSGWVGYYGVVRLKKIFNYDDSLDAFGIHGLVGIWGALATGIFANPAINGEAGAFYGNPEQLIAQAASILITIVYSAIGTFVIYKFAAWITRGARVNIGLELNGLDKAYHRETSFSE